MAKKAREVLMYRALVFGHAVHLTQHKCLCNLLILSFCFTIDEAPDIYLDCSNDTMLLLNMLTQF